MRSGLPACHRDNLSTALGIATCPDRTREELEERQLGAVPVAETGLALEVARRRCKWVGNHGPLMLLAHPALLVALYNTTTAYHGQGDRHVDAREDLVFMRSL